jgi:hypothetical protein
MLPIYAISAADSQRINGRPLGLRLDVCAPAKPQNKGTGSRRSRKFKIQRKSCGIVICTSYRTAANWTRNL